MRLTARRFTIDPDKQISTTDGKGAADGVEVKCVDPVLFLRIRQAFGVDEANFYASICLQPGRAETDMTMIGGSEAAGKSGAFFFLSPDQFYIFKSTKETEVTLLRKILPDYAAHMEANPGSILPRYLGLFTCNVGERSLTFLCMTNAFGGVHQVQHRYDLKGSTHNRFASEKERGKTAPVLKDLDWHAEGRRLPIDSSFVATLEADVGFLARCALIDYSLLVGLATKESNAAPERTPGLISLCGASGTDVLYLALVDILTCYTCKKVAEHRLTGTLFCCRDVSCQPPLRYASRFMAFVKSVSEAVKSEGDAGAKAAAGNGGNLDALAAAQRA